MYRYVAKTKLFSVFWLKIFVPVTRVGVRENFHPCYRDLGNRASPASHMNISKFFVRRKEWQVVISETDPARLTGLI